MSETNPITTDTVIIREPDGEEIKWRTRRMVSLGATTELATTIANSHVDLHDIDRLLKAGCPLELAWKITRPANEPHAVNTAVEPVSADDEN